MKDYRLDNRKVMYNYFRNTTEMEVAMTTKTNAGFARNAASAVVSTLSVLGIAGSLLAFGEHFRRLVAYNSTTWSHLVFERLGMGSRATNDVMDIVQLIGFAAVPLLIGFLILGLFAGPRAAIASLTDGMVFVAGGITAAVLLLLLALNWFEPAFLIPAVLVLLVWLPRLFVEFIGPRY